MSPESTPNPTIQQTLLKIIKPLATGPAQVLFYGSAILAIIATGGTALPGVLGTLGTTIGVNVLSNMLERVAIGDEVPDDEIRRVVREAIDSSGIEKLVTSNEFQRAIAHVFRQFDLLKYAVQKGEFTIVSMLTDQFTKHTVILEVMQSDLSIVRSQMETLSTREQSAEILKTVLKIAEQLENQLPSSDIRSAGGIRRLRIFLASPSDVLNERNLFRKVVDEFNEPGGLAEQLNIHIQVLGWEQAVSSMGNAEKVILDQSSVSEWDIFIGILWKRFGSPTGNVDKATGLPFNSGTEEEFIEGLSSWQKTGRPHILFYRCKAPIEVDESDLDIDQYKMVQLFFDRFKTAAGNPGLFTSYRLPIDFERRVRIDLIKLLHRILNQHQTKKPQSTPIESIPQNTTVSSKYTGNAASPNSNHIPSDKFSDMRQEIQNIRAQLDATNMNLIQILTDEAREGPRLYSLIPSKRSSFDPKEWVSAKFKLVLWCEYSRLPLPVLNKEGSRKGVYDIELFRENFKQVSPYLRALTNTLSLVLPIASPSIKALYDEDDIDRSLENKFGKSALDSLFTENEKIGDWLGGEDIISLEYGVAIRAEGGVLRELHALLREKDPGFGGLVRVMNKRHEFLWVHEKFAGEY